MERQYLLLSTWAAPTAPPTSVRYSNRVMMGLLPEWVAMLLILVCIWLAVTVVLWKLAPSWHQQKRKFWQSAALAGWLTIVGYSALTWLNTIFQHHGRLRAAVSLAAALAILFATFILEGLEMAYSELRDKDEHQFEGKAALVFGRLTELGGRDTSAGQKAQELESRERDRRGGAFFEAREWWIVLLLVVATLMLENEDYYAPWMAHIYDTGDWGRTFRVVITIILTTFPFVWIAQSPGKYVARQNSVEFLSYRFTDFTILLLEVLWWLMRKVGLQFPAEVF